MEIRVPSAIALYGALSIDDVFRRGFDISLTV